MRNVVTERLKRMSDEELFSECVIMGKVMETRSIDPGYMSVDEKIRAKQVFEEAHSRDSLIDHRGMFSTALKVLEII